MKSETSAGGRFSLSTAFDFRALGRFRLFTAVGSRLSNFAQAYGVAARSCKVSAYVPVSSPRICSCRSENPIVDFQNGARVSRVVLDYGVAPAATNKVVIRLVAFPVLLVVSALLRGLCGARRLRSFCLLPHPSGSGSPVPVPPEKQLLDLGTAPTRFRVPETNGQNKEKRMYLNRITLIGFIGSDAERKATNATNIAIFSLATKTSWKNDAGSWESRTEWHRCVAFGKLADFAGSLTKGAHIAIEGELRSREYQRELTVGTQKTTLTQRVWEIRVDSVLKLDRAAKREASDENHEEVPQ